MSAKFVPATGWGRLLAWYDPAVAILTRERSCKRHLLESAQLQPNMRVLDVGCGTGTLALAALTQHPEVTVEALDIDSRVLDQAKRKPGSTAVAWVQGNASCLPHPSDSFDRVFCSLLFHHLTPEEKQHAACEMRRVLTPSGRLLFADYGLPESVFAKLRFLTVRALDGWQRTRCNVIGRIPDVLQAAGFGDVQQTLVLSTLLGTLRCYVAQATQTQKVVSE
ncbi:MAG: methyltransferase domain-containing protein [Planctomycetales bacterium]|nr:methyltransferase domain-containing protein [Planctomycetales bacterium]